MVDSPEEIVTYLVAGVLDRDGALGKTKLVKLLYLVDVDYYARFRRIVTGFVWQYYFYGPYDSQIEDVLRRIDFDVPQEKIEIDGGLRAIVFRPRDISYLLDRVRLSDRAAGAADRVLDKWALEDLYPLLDYVYFHTEPMQAARPGQRLDFGTVREYWPPRLARPLPPIDPEAFYSLRQRLDAATRERLRLRELTKNQQRSLFAEDDRFYGAMMRRFHRTEEPSSNLSGMTLVAPSWADEA